MIPTGISGVSYEIPAPITAQIHKSLAGSSAPDLPVAFDRSPKVRFQRGQGNIERHRQLLDNPAYDKGRDFALLELVRNIVSQPVNTPNDAIAGFYRIMGAVEQQHKFQDLSEQPTMPSHRALSTQNLNHLA